MTQERTRPQDLYPLAPLQKGLLFESLRTPGAGIAFEQDLYVLHGELDVERFKRAWEAVVERHAVLRTTFIWEDIEEPHQIVHHEAPVVMSIADWRDTNAETRENKLQTLMRAEREEGFVLTQLPLMRLNLIRTEGLQHWLVLNFHHVLLDGWSLPTLIRDVLSFYENGAFNKPAPPIYRNYVGWIFGQNQDHAEAFWRGTLKDFTSPTPLIGAHCAIEESPAINDDVYKRSLHRLSREYSEKVNAYAREHRLTFSTLIQAIWALLLSRYARVDEVMFGCNVSGRPPSLYGVEDMVGLFINTLPLRIDANPEMKVGEWLRSIQDRVLELQEYGYSSLSDIQKWSELPSSQALFESLVVVENYPDLSDTAGREGGLSVDYQSWKRHSKTGYPLSFLALPSEEILLEIKYNSRQFSKVYIKRMLAHLETLLRGLTSDVNMQIGMIPLLAESEREVIVRKWNNTERDYPRGILLHELFEAQAAKVPHAPALIFDDNQLSYAELNRRTNQLAHHLRSHSIGPDQLVGVFMERSIEMVVALYGILKAGGAYVPIDPEYPKQRIVHMIGDSGVRIILTQERIASELPHSEAMTLCLDSDWDAISRAGDDNPQVPLSADNVAYMIYTSGSTGKPKGALNAHKGIVNRLLWMQDQFKLEEGDVALQKTPFSFDVSVWEFFWPLITGATLVMAEPGGHRDPSYLVDCIEQRGVSVIHFVPSMLRIFLEAPDVDRCRSLRYVVCSGEALPPDLVDAFHKKLPCELHNLYGPTEAAVDVTHYHCPRVEKTEKVPIGRPIANTRCYILDKWMQCVPIGIAGELHLGGVQVGLGYHNRPELTAEKFVPDPFSEEPGDHLYKTGDLCCFHADGSIEYLGRMDHQVKLHGLRIELGEIEEALLELGSVKETVVVATTDESGDQQLLAYYVPAVQPQPSSQELASHLRKTLPDYMVPQSFMPLESLPLSPNGKLDRKALPKPELKTLPILHPAAPENELERKIAEIWKEVLNLSQVDTRSNFFDLGGQSLKLMRVNHLIAENLGFRTSITDLFANPTISMLAEHLTEQNSTDSNKQEGLSQANRKKGQLQRQKMLKRLRNRK